MLTSSADDFFSPNLEIIASHFHISESVAGVTFLAFGTDAPDIFGSIASVLGATQPKADLALGGLLGGAIFVTLVVHASVAIVHPFKCDFWSTTRDLVFLLFTTAAILCFLLFFKQIQLWQPLTFLGIYIIYLAVVFATDHFKNKRATNDTKETNTVTPPIQIGDGDEVEKEAEQTSGNSTGNGAPAEWKEWYEQLLSFFALDYGDVENPSKFCKIKSYILWPITTLFKLTTPLADAPWLKPLAIIQSVLVPQCILFNIKLVTFVPIDRGPGLYAYAPIISIHLIVFILCATSTNAEPRFYKAVYSLLGFASSVTWIYCLSTGVVGVVNMLGIVSGLNQAVLGLTVMAWASSISDLVADIAVARQGFPKMAIAATIGGALFNILIGFGIPFTISKIQGDQVPIALDDIKLVMIVFLFISTIVSLATLIIFKGQLSRAYGILLVVIYCLFLVFIVLSETGVLVWF
ncbi:hypothetical protein PMAYCL1PPCAC_00862 [Pristionchus mayeri]|uniref:Sodium/calcium exchanger membrane region domain-containing protein n=1 Tax=Pristionchus mayeri TaxID=1317129 RepID=A0AAN4YX84_9BILA|nr:hypothetical protein PMAYCL1PPCAC_00862 [Pristionchus mayeri]